MQNLQEKNAEFKKKNIQFKSLKHNQNQNNYVKNLLKY